jgi:DNA invertase Pin-like site-specific DNA recombinase
MPSTKCYYAKGEGGLLSPLETGQLINGVPPCGTVDRLIVLSEGHKTSPAVPGACGRDETRREGRTMPSTNGHGLKRAILYARVSTEEQAKSGYSLAQQMEALREYAAREGYEILEEVTDPGQSGASLERPGMDRIRRLVEDGGVSAVLAQDRDRIAREPAYHYLLKKEFEEHECKIRALNDRGDDSPEGELTDGILDQLAKFERAKTAERARRGRLRKAREGKISATHTPAYGFSYNASRDGYLVNEETMPAVVRVFEDVAGGLSLRATAKALARDRIPSPTGKQVWNSYSLRAMILDDLYRPHTPEEIQGLVQEGLLTAGVAGRLDPSRPYGIWWGNTVRNNARTVAELDEVGGRRYRKRRKTVPRPRTEWIAVPIDLTGSGLEREIVDLARAAIKDNVRPSSAGGRSWEVVGFVFCTACGRRLHPHTTKGGRTNRLYYYYQCDNREGCGARPRIQAGKVRSRSLAGRQGRSHRPRAAQSRPRPHDRAGAQRRVWRSGTRSEALGREALRGGRRTSRLPKARSPRPHHRRGIG